METTLKDRNTTCYASYWNFRESSKSKVVNCSKLSIM